MQGARRREASHRGDLPRRRRGPRPDRTLGAAPQPAQRRSAPRADARGRRGGRADGRGHAVFPGRGRTARSRAPRDRGRARRGGPRPGARAGGAARRSAPRGPALAVARGRVEIGSVALLADGIAVRRPALRRGGAAARLGLDSASCSTVYSLVDTVVLNVEGTKRVVLLWNGVQRARFSGHVDTARPLAAAPRCSSRDERSAADRRLRLRRRRAHRRARRCARALPDESILYLGDTARLPYGTKSPGDRAPLHRRNVEFLEARGVKAVVVACNTASALALDDLADAGCRSGAWSSRARRAPRGESRGRVGVIATEATVRSGRLRPRRCAACGPSSRCCLRPARSSCRWSRRAGSTIRSTEAVARRYLDAAARGARIDTLVLGCTHYPLLAPLLAPRRRARRSRWSTRRRRSPSAGGARPRRAPASPPGGEREARASFLRHRRPATASRGWRAMILGEERVSLELVDV